mgnify:FL=1
MQNNKTAPKYQRSGRGLASFLSDEGDSGANADYHQKGLGERHPLPHYAVIKEISYQDVAFTYDLGNKFFYRGASGSRNKIEILLRLILKLREIGFFIKSIPSLVKFKPDVIHVHGLVCILGGIFGKSVLGSRFVITLHGITEATLVQKFPVLRYLLTYSDKVICVSSAIQNSLLKFIAATKLAVIPGGVDLELFRNLNLPRKNQLVAVGYLKWQKGYSYLLEAIAALTKFSHYRLVIIGDGPERRQIEEQIERLHLTDRVDVLGLLSQQEIVEHLNESKLFIMSSLAEGLPKVLLEAMACGTPSVLTTACNAEGIIEGVGTAVEPGNSLALANAIEELLSDEERWNRLSKNCLEVAQGYGWETMAAKTLELYKRL